MRRLMVALTALLAVACTERLEVITLGGDAGAGEPTCTPGFRCPEGATFVQDAGWGSCIWRDIPLPAPAADDLRPYCEYFTDQYMGFLWTPTPGDPTYECPWYADTSGNGTQTFCLFQGYAVPPDGAERDCDALSSEARLGFRWPCP